MKVANTRRDFILTLFVVSILYLCLFSLHSLYAQDKEKAILLYKESVKLFEIGNIDRAIETIKEAIKADLNYAEAYDHLGYLLLKKGQVDDAIDAFNSALKINPRIRSSKTGLGIALAKKGDLKGAESILLDALKLNPYPSMTHYALGLVYEKLVDYEKAIMHYKEGIRTYKVTIGKQ